MLDFFVILTKGGIRLWCYPATVEIFRISINTFLKSLILKAAYQNVLQLNYVDKFLTAIALEFRDKYKNELVTTAILCNFDEFQPIYLETLKRIELEHRTLRNMAKPMRTFEQSDKANKTVASMIVSRNKKPVERTDRKPQANKTSVNSSPTPTPAAPEPVMIKPVNGSIEEDVYAQNRKKLLEKMKSKKQKETASPTASPVQKPNGKRVKELRKWDNAATGEEAAALDFSSPPNNATNAVGAGDQKGYTISTAEATSLSRLRGTMKDELEEVQVSDEEFIPEDEIDASKVANTNQVDAVEQKAKAGSSGGLVSNLLRGLRLPGGTSRVLTLEDISPSLEQLRDRLVAKNVAMEIAQRVCDSVADRLIGTPLGAFERVYTRVRSSLEEVCARVLASGRRVDVLRDAMDARSQGRPYTIVFCGVNGVGKSTNLAKVSGNSRIVFSSTDYYSVA
ncbi:unnamed protein product, partial [Echinostoma caproni]|uniref:SRP-alpha_N domain-containing protein n=1 Tax=Echinostoma caproni TaxID=27848 RepID=A0A183AYD8_9TREM